MPRAEFMSTTRPQLFAVMDAYKKYHPLVSKREEQQLSEMEEIHAELNA